MEIKGDYFEFQKFISEISHSIGQRYGSTLDEIADNATSELFPISLNPFLSSCRSKADPEQSLLNQSNSWYSECFLSHPSIHALTKETTSKELNIYFETTNKQFTGWRFIIAYYSMFFALSGMLRVIDGSYKGGHKKIIGVFNDRFYSRRFPSDFLLYPFHSTLDGLANEPFAEFLERCLIRNDKKQKITLFDIFYLMREKVNYQIPSQFLKSTKKTRYQVNLTLNLQRTSFLFNLIADIFLIKSLGFIKVYHRYRRFARYLRRTRLKPYPLSIKFSHYMKYFKIKEKDLKKALLGGRISKKSAELLPYVERIEFSQHPRDVAIDFKGT